MTKDELREAVAKALCLQFYGTEWDATPEFRQDFSRGMADAALTVVREALREPTRVMIVAAMGYEPVDFSNTGCACDWRAMLAASPLGGGDE